ncbi:MAG: hypothetical protein JSU01_02680 [Bacteroidetes bacterium]|nr:hypothetical protein [Bacteroidota bacterium]
MRLYIATFAAIILMPLLSFAQNNFKPGYVVNAKGDTISGSIDYKEWEKNPAQVAFKDNSGVVKNYTPQDAKGFGVNGLEYFEAHKVNISLDPADVNKAGSVLDTSYQSNIVFLKTITKGRYVSLFSYQDYLKMRYYILEPGYAEPRELTYHVYTDQDGAVKYVRRYRGQLQYIASKNNVNNGDLAHLLSKANYDQKDILSAVMMINGTESAQFVSKSQFGTRLFIGAAAVNNSMQFTGVYTTPAGGHLTANTAFGIDLLTNKDIQHLIFRIEIAATADMHKFTNVVVSGSSAPGTINFNQYTGSVVPQIMYNFYNTNKLKVFLDAGISVNVSTYPNSYVSQDFPISGTVKSSNTITYNGVWESFPIKAGVALNKKLELYACYVPSATLSSNYSAGITSYRVGFNYLFGTK